MRMTQTHSSPQKWRTCKNFMKGLPFSRRDGEKWRRCSVGKECLHVLRAVILFLMRNIANHFHVSMFQIESPTRVDQFAKATLIAVMSKDDFAVDTPVTATMSGCHHLRLEQCCQRS